MFLHFFVFRHGETDWNAQKKFQGHSDIVLNANGEKQALELQKKLVKLKLKKIVSSDLKRALKTAEIARGTLNIPIEITADLRETHLGEAEGLTHLEINARYGEGCVESWRSIDPAHSAFSFPKGEKKSEHLLRLRRALEKEAHSGAHKAGEQIGVSTHGGSLVRLAHACVGSPMEVIAIPNCVLYELKYDMMTKTWHFVGIVSE